MKLRLLVLLFSCAAGIALAQESGFAVRQTELKQEPYSDAATTGALAERAQVRIISRQGGWLRIESASGAGWVRMLAIRTGATESKGGESGLKQLFNVARSGSSGTAVATGVRGLDREQIRNAQPNTAELARMAQFAASQAEAERFANSAGLTAQAIDYLPEQQSGSAEPAGQ